MTSKSLIICEDHPIYAKGLKDFLENHFNVIGIFDKGKELVSFLKNNNCDLLILDLNLTDGSGLDVINEIKDNNSDTKIVVVSMYNDKLLIEKCKKLGVHAYCGKQIINSELLAILNNVEKDNFLIDNSIKYKLQKKKSNNNLEDFEIKMNLTSREKELIQLFSEGLSSKEVSNKLNVSILTINTHKKNIYKKLNINSTAELVAFYYENF